MTLRWGRDDLWAALLIAALTLMAGWPLLTPRLIATHDGMTVLARLSQVVLHAGDGQWLVRWAPEAQYGYGGPLFLFYPPAFFYLAAGLARLGAGLVPSIHWTALMLWIASGLGMYVLARAWIGRAGALLSAVAYVYAPYHISLAYVRGAMAEFTAMAVLPWAAWAFLQGVHRSGAAWRVAAACGIAALILAHHFIALIGVAWAVVLLAGIAVRPRPQRWAMVRRGALSLALGLALSAFYWLPANVLGPEIAASRMVEGSLDYARNFVSWAQLIGRGAALSVTFQIGSVIGLLAAAGLARSLWLRRQLPAGPLAAAALVALVSAWMMTASSRPLWNAVPLLRFGQFPWRLAVYTSFGLSLLAGAVALGWPRPVRRGLAGAGIAAVIATNLAACTAFYTHIDRHAVPSQATFDGWRREFASLAWEDFLPRWAERAPQASPANALEVIEGQVLIEEEPRRAVVRRWTLDAPTPSRIRASTLYFPGWRLLIDGTPAPIRPAEGSGLIEFDVPQGARRLELRFVPPAICRIATLISWAALLGCAIVLARRDKRAAG